MEINVKLMCAKAQVDLEKVSGEMEQQFQAALKNAAVATFNEGKRLATERLKTTSKDWLKAFTFGEIGKNTYLIQLKNDPNAPHGLPPTWIEGGFGAFDMKPGLLKGGRAKKGKNGPYNTVPFEHSTGAVPKDLGSAIRQQGLNAIIKEKNLSKIKKDVTGVPMQGTVARVRTGATFGQISAKTQSILGDQAKHLDGLTKIQKTYEKKTESRYMTFRRVSKRSKPNSWQHPGFEGAKIFPTLEQFLRNDVEKIINNILK